MPIALEESWSYYLTAVTWTYKVGFGAMRFCDRSRNRKRCAASASALFHGMVRQSFYLTALNRQTVHQNSVPPMNLIDRYCISSCDVACNVEPWIVLKWWQCKRMAKFGLDRREGGAMFSSHTTDEHVACHPWYIYHIFFLLSGNVWHSQIEFQKANSVDNLFELMRQVFYLVCYSRYNTMQWIAAISFPRC